MTPSACFSKHQRCFCIIFKVAGKNTTGCASVRFNSLKVYHDFKAANCKQKNPEKKEVSSEKILSRKFLHLVFTVKELPSLGRNKCSGMLRNNIKSGLEGEFPLMKMGSKDNAKCC